MRHHHALQFARFDPISAATGFLGRPAMNQGVKSPPAGVVFWRWRTVPCQDTLGPSVLPVPRPPRPKNVQSNLRFQKRLTALPWPAFLNLS